MFYTQKREEILNAAQRIALEKPLPHVSMKDLIRACGVSQGAMQFCCGYLGLRYDAAVSYLRAAPEEPALDAYLDLQLRSRQLTTLYLPGLEEANETA